MDRSGARSDSFLAAYRLSPGNCTLGTLGVEGSEPMPGEPDPMPGEPNPILSRGPSNGAGGNRSYFGKPPVGRPSVAAAREKWHHGVLASALRNSDVIIGATNFVSSATIIAWIVRAPDPIPRRLSPQPGQLHPGDAWR